jgi:hypothetical protein
MQTKQISAEENQERHLTIAEQTLCEMVVWSFTHEYLPLHKGKDVPDYEKGLAKRWSRVQQNHKAPDDPLRERIDKISSLFKSRRTNAEQTICEMVVWSFTHEYLPRRDGKNVPDYEKGLARRWNSVQQDHKSSDDPLRERIDKINGLFKSKLITTEQTLCEMVVWSFTHEYLPRKTGKNVSDYEKGLAQRWNRVQQNHKSPDDPLRERIDRINGLFKRKRTNPEQTLCEMVVWSFTHEYLPLHKGKDVSDYEKDLLQRWNGVQQFHKSPDDPLRGRIDKINSLFKRRRNSRHLSPLKYTGEKLVPLAQKPRRIIDYASPISVGTAILDGRFEKDAANIANPRGLDTDTSPKHDRETLSGNFTWQEAVETTIYTGIRDLLRCVESRTNFDRARSRRATPRDPETRNTAPELYKINAAEDFVLKLAELADRKDSGRLLDAYEASAAAPDNIEKARILAGILKDLKIEYNKNLQTAYSLVFSANYAELIALLQSIPLAPENQRLISGTVTILTLFKTGAAGDEDFYRQLSVQYDLPLRVGSLGRLIRIARLNLLRFAQTREIMREITQEAEELL